MAKLVLLRFENDADADEHLLDPSKSELVGIYKVPTQFCDCPPEKRGVPPGSTTRGESTSKRGSKYGWWVRTCCNRPARNGAQRPVNLKEKAEGIAPYQQKYGVFVNVDMPQKS